MGSREAPAVVLKYIREDWKENPVRTVFESLAWVISFVCTVIMALTVPNPPFLLVYPLFITQCSIFAVCAYTRGSTGMLANYVMLIGIDSFALIRLIFMQ